MCGFVGEPVVTFRGAQAVPPIESNNAHCSCARIVLRFTSRASPRCGQCIAQHLSDDNVVIQLRPWAALVLAAIHTTMMTTM